MSKGPTVADLVRMGGGRRRDLETVILPFEEAILLHEVIMSAPPAGAGKEVPADDKRLVLLRDCGLVRQDAASQRWLPTQEGVKHMMPTRRPNRAARRAAESVLDQVNRQTVVEYEQMKRRSS